MALRVLLADESISIKKVMQLSLQDYGVEVKAVPVGLDVLEVAQSFLPDIVFADILLSKKNGYEVAKELKDNPRTANIPLVLMWSGFMELDAEKAREAQIAGELEKPFDADQLRTLVKKLVPRLGKNVIADYLEFPDRPSFEENQEAPLGLDLNPSSVSLRRNLEHAPEALSFSSMEISTPSKDEDSLPFLAEMDEPEDFQQVPLPRTRNNPLVPEAGDESWSSSKLTDFLVEMPDDSQAFESPEQDLTSASIALSGEESEVSLEELDLSSSELKSRASTYRAPEREPSTQMETIVREEIRAQTQQVLEDIAWKIIPEMAERIIREELEKLLKESQNLTS
jgi:CheY-like chemotaxis protein